MLLAVIIGILSSSFYPHTTDDFYVYAATTEQQKADFSGSTLINQGSPYLGDPSTVHITIIDFSDFQCYLCARYVKARAIG